MGKLFNTDKQLTSSFINQVYLDRDGFIWAVTRNGLNKYDGYQFHIYKKETEQDAGMASNYVNCMMQDSNGLFYMGMYGALQTYDGSRFYDVEVKDLNDHVVPCYITCFLQRENGDVLAGTSGHGLLKISGRQNARQIGGALGNIHTVNELIEDRRGSLWIVTNEAGLLEYNGKTVKRYFTGNGQRTTLKRVCKDREGNIYVGTSNNGIFVQTAAGGSFRHIGVTAGKSVSALYCKHNGQLVIGYDGQGLGIYDPKTGTMADNPYYSCEVDLSKSKVYSIVEDHSGNIWLGLLQKGIYMHPGKNTGFGYMGYKLGTLNTIGSACVIGTFIDSKGRTWVGTDKDGLYCIDGSNRPVKHFKNNFPNSIMSITEDRKGRIWIGSYSEGFGWIDTSSMQYHKYNLPRPQYESLSAFAMQVTERNDLWIATMGHGLLSVNPDNGQMRVYRMQEGAAFDRNVNSIANDYISHVSVSPDGKRVYAATTMGICCLDIEKDSWLSTFGRNCPNYGSPIRVAKEYGGKLWMGTNDGLYCYDLKSKQQKHYTTGKGLPDNGIAAIEQDKAGRLWISTAHGMCCHDMKTGLTQSFFVDNGLQSNEFSDGASCTAPSGKMLFGGVGGITWFDPLTIKQNGWAAAVKLTAFLINGVPVNATTKSGAYQVCDTTVITGNRFQLAYHDNSFAIQLSTLTYDNPEHITYLYSINGEPFAQLQPGVNEITFSHLPPGTYRFRVKAERNNQSTPERGFTVIVHAPWYRTGWAYSLYALLLALAVWQYIRFRQRKEQDRLQLQEHIHAEEMSEAKIRFFMNISHGIRTPMTLIITPLLQLMKEDDDPHRRSVYETIKRNAERILHLINQMMDLRKIDKGQMQMRMSKTDLIGFVGDIHTLFKYQAKAKSITLRYEHDADHLPVWVDRQNFDKVVVNILSNAFKFTPTGGNIGIRITHDEQYAIIAVSNDGEQIPEDKLDKIFERFYRVPSDANDRNIGTGIGLDLTRSLVELHYGIITARNTENGCEFAVSIPLGNAHLKPEEMITEKDSEAPALALAELEEEDMQEMPEIKIRPGRRMTIVIAEDDDEIRDYLSAELGQDYDVRACTNGREALAEVYRTHPDIVLSDIMMPEMNGNALCIQLKSNKSTNHIPIILLTAKSHDEDKLEGLETGADAYIVKPFNMAILRCTINNLIRSHRLLQMKYGKTDMLEKQVDEIKVKSPDEKLLERMMLTVNKHINNSDLNVDMIADEVGISRVHLHRKMKELTGQTPHEFIRGIRLKQAANLLASQNMNITEVVCACGFSNAASFSTMFKNVYGMAPREYMKEHKQKQG